MYKYIKYFKNKRVISFSVLFFVILLLLFQKFTSGVKINIEDKAQVILGNLEEYMTIAGAIDTEEKVTLRFQTSGRLAWVGVKEGDTVKKFQSIAALDKRELKKTLEKKLNDYLKARIDFDEAHLDTYKDKVLTPSIKRVLDKTQYDLNESVLDVEIQTLAVEDANLWTPISGLVVRVSQPIAGVNITPLQAEIEIVNPQTVYFAAIADQTEVVNLVENMEGVLTLDSYPETTLSGKIKDISFLPKIDDIATLYKIKFVFVPKNSDYKYRPGMTGDLSFVTRRKENALHIPQKFVKNINNKKMVRVVRNGRIKNVEVTLGMETDTDVEITSGLILGEVIYE